MKIILTSVGTRGDMEPFIAIGELLKERGHRIICAFPEQFRENALEADLEFASLGTKFVDLLESDEGKAAMGGASGFKKFVGTVKLSLKQTEANKELLIRQQEIIGNENPDRIVYNGKAVYPIIWEMKNKGKTILLSPIPYMHYVRGHSHVAFNSNFGTVLNKLTFLLANIGMITTIKISKKWLKIHEKINRKEIRGVLRHSKTIYTISPSLFSRPDYWQENLKVVGYHECERNSVKNTDNALNEFLDKHEKVLFITFGSMINTAPEEKTRIFLEILEHNKIPAIINTAAGGLVRPERFSSDYIRFVSDIPYNIIFPKVYGVIHHGGAGTTHLALKYGCATLIIPHIIDQYVWNSIISAKGAGPGGIRINRIKIKKLEPLILDLLSNAAYKMKAEQIRDQMMKEDLKEYLYDSIIL